MSSFLSNTVTKIWVEYNRWDVLKSIINYHFVYPAYKMVIGGSLEYYKP